jgi:hypothetical protein
MTALTESVDPFAADANHVMTRALDIADRSGLEEGLEHIRRSGLSEGFQFAASGQVEWVFGNPVVATCAAFMAREHEPDSPWCLRAAAGILVACWRDEALEFAERAIELDPDVPEGYRLRAEAIKQAEGSAAALAAVDEALGRFPDQRGLLDLRLRLLSDRAESDDEDDDDTAEFVDELRRRIESGDRTAEYHAVYAANVSERDPASAAASWYVACDVPEPEDESQVELAKSIRGTGWFPLNLILAGLARLRRMPGWTPLIPLGAGALLLRWELPQNLDWLAIPKVSLQWVLVLSVIATGAARECFTILFPWLLPGKASLRPITQRRRTVFLLVVAFSAAMTALDGFGNHFRAARYGGWFAAVALLFMLHSRDRWPRRLAVASVIVEFLMIQSRVWVWELIPLGFPPVWAFRFALQQWLPLMKWIWGISLLLCLRARNDPD